MAQRGIPCLWMRGGTSKAACFLADDLPADPVRRDAVLLAVMGSPDPRQIDGIGGADPLTSKVAIIRRPHDLTPMWTIYLPGERGGGYRGLWPKLRQYSCRRWPFRHRARSGSPRCAAHSGAYFMENTGQLAVAEIPCDADGVNYVGESRIDGVPGSASPILLHFLDVAGSSAGRCCRPAGFVTVLTASR